MKRSTFFSSTRNHWLMIIALGCIGLIVWFFWSHTPVNAPAVTTPSPKETARQAGLAYVRALLACDRPKIDELSMAPMTNEKFATCRNTGKLADGTTISNTDLTVTISSVEYSTDTDPELGTVESALMYPSITYRGKGLGQGPANLIMMSRYPSQDNVWKSIK